METTHPFERATRLKLRFESTRGALSIEDLWDLPLTSTPARPSLDAIAVGLHVQLRNTADVASFVVPAADNGNDELRLKFEIVKHIIGVRIKERDDLKAAADRGARKQRLLELIAQKEDQALGEKPIDELRALAESL